LVADIATPTPIVTMEKFGFSVESTQGMTQPHVDQSLARLSEAHAILSCNGHDDLTLGHMALRDPKGRGFWIKRADVGMRELTGPTGYQLLAFEGKLVSGTGKQHSEWPIHSQLMQSRLDVNISVHTHTEWPTLLSVFDSGMRALTTDAGYLGKVTTLALEASHADTPTLGAEVAKAFVRTMQFCSRTTASCSPGARSNTQR